METVEIIVYITIAIIVGSMILVATMSLASPQTYDRISNLFTGDSKQEFATVGDSSLTQFLLSFWDECNYGISPQNITFQYTGEGFSKAEVFADVQAMGLCDEFSSSENDCGKREDLATQTIEPGIHTASCSREGSVGELVIN